MSRPNKYCSSEINLEKRRPNKYCSSEINLDFHMYTFSLMCQRVTLFWKKENSLKCWLYFHPFLWRTQKSFKLMKKVWWWLQRKSCDHTLKRKNQNKYYHVVTLLFMFAYVYQIFSFNYASQIYVNKKSICCIKLLSNQ